MSWLARALGALVALGVVASIAIGGCHSTAEEHPPPTAAAVSHREAARVLSGYAAAARTITRPRDADRIPRVMSGPIAAVTTGRLKIDAFGRHKRSGGRSAVPTPSGAYVRPAFWIPRHTEHEPWFVASAGRTGAAGRELLLFTRTGDRTPFTAAYVIRLDPGTRLPKVRGGEHPRAVAVTDGRLAVRPDALATAHASIEQNGPQAAAAASFEPSEWTTAAHATDNDDRRTARKSGFAYRRAYQDSGYPEYALGTGDGGALVWYAVTDELSVTQDDPSIARAPLKLSAGLAGVVGARRVRRAFQAVSVHQYLAYVPPRGRGKVRILASAGGPVGGVGH